MYTDLCEFELAKQYMKTTPMQTQSPSKTSPSKKSPDKPEKTAIQELISKQADWASTINDSKTAM